MKKRIIASLCYCACLVFLCACAATKSCETGASASAPDAAGEMAQNADQANNSQSKAVSRTSSASPTISPNSSTVFSAAQSGSLSDKIIYTAEADLETKDFDGTLDKIDQLSKRYKAFTESASVTGTNYKDAYYGHANYRTATFVLRVPRAAYDALTKSLPDLCNVISFNSHAENITGQFTDTDARKAACETEEKRLLALLDKAENMEDILTIENRLSEVRYQIESLTSSLNNWQNQVDYSTVSIHITEVAALSDQNPLPHTYWESVYAAIRANCISVYHFFRGLLKYILAAVPIVILPGAFILIIWYRFRRKHASAGGTEQPKLAKLPWLPRHTKRRQANQTEPSEPPEQTDQTDSPMPPDSGASKEDK